MSWTDERIERLKKMWDRRRDRQPDRRGARRGQPQCRDRQGAPPGPRSRVLAGQAERGQGARSARRPPQPRARAKAAARARTAPHGRPARRCPGAAAPSPIAAAPARQRARPRDIRYPLDRPRRLHPPGSGRPAGADPARAAAPPGSRQAERRGRRQDQPARSQRPHLQMADRPSGRARFPLLRRQGESRLPLLRRALRQSPIRRSSPAAIVARRRRCRSGARASAERNGSRCPRLARR